MLPKLAVFDVDGTLVSYDGGCSPAVRTALTRLRSAGVVTAIATGRPRQAIAETLAMVGPVDYAVCGNGSTVTHVETDRVIRRSVVPGDLTERLVPAVRNDLPGVGIAIDVDDRIVEEAGLHQRLPPRDPVPTVPDALAAIGSPVPDHQRVIFFHDDFDGDLPGLASYLEPHVDDRVDIFHAMLLPVVEVIPAGDNKAAALADLVAHIAISAADVVAVGDGVNDVEMLRWAGRSVAMAHARPEVRAAADAVTGSVEDDGVAVFVEALFEEVQQ